MNVTKTGSGAITLSGPVDNAFMDLHVQQGTLVAGKASAIGVHVASNITGIDSGTSCNNRVRAISRCTKEVP